MSITFYAGGGPNQLLAEVEALSGQRLSGCYQCGACAAGCPFVAAMDLLPDALIRRLCLGLPDVLARQSFWLCVGCDTCSERCPRGIDLPRVMEALRRIWISRNGDRLELAGPATEARGELPAIALVASMRRNT